MFDSVMVISQLRSFGGLDTNIAQLQVHHEVAEGTVDVAAVALHSGVVGRVHKVD